MENNTPLVQRLDVIPLPPWDEVARLKVYTPDYRRLSWLQVWQAFHDAYPNRWALELYPPAEELVDDAHVYHLWLLPEEWQPPDGMNLATRLQTDGGQQQAAGDRTPQVSQEDALAFEAWLQSLREMVEKGELLQHAAVFPERFEHSDFRAIWDLRRPYIYVTDALYQELLRWLKEEKCDFFLYAGRLFTIGNAAGGYALMPLLAEREAYYLNHRREMG